MKKLHSNREIYASGGGLVVASMKSVLRDRWAEVDEIWHVYSMGRGTKLLRSGILNFSPRITRGHPGRSLGNGSGIRPCGRDGPPDTSRNM